MSTRILSVRPSFSISFGARPFFLTAICSFSSNALSHQSKYGRHSIKVRDMTVYCASLLLIPRYSPEPQATVPARKRARTKIPNISWRGALNRHLVTLTAKDYRRYLSPPAGSTKRACVLSGQNASSQRQRPSRGKSEAKCRQTCFNLEECK